MKREFFTAQTLADLKTEYRKLAKKYHPDMGGDTATMQRLNNEYDKLAEYLAHHEAKGTTEQERTTNANNAYTAARGMREALERIIHCVGISIEICGTWIWVSGSTYTAKDILKSAGFEWASAKKQWFWKPAEQWAPRKGYHYTMEQIREMHGSVYVQTEAQAQLN